MAEQEVVEFYDLPVLKCDFYWDTATLQKNIRAYKSDYKFEDSWTWPRIDSQAHPGYEGHMYESSLPEGVAYASHIVSTFTRRCHRVRVKQTVSGNSEVMDHDFLHFPYQYSKENKPRLYDRLNATSRAAWIESVTGISPQEPSDSTAFEKKTNPQKPVSSTEASDEFIKMMGDTRSDNTAKAKTLREELSEVRKKLTITEEEKARVAEQMTAAQVAQADAEARVKILENDCASFKRIAGEYTYKYRTESRDLQASYNEREEETAMHEQEVAKSEKLSLRIQALEQLLKEKGEDLTVVREEAETAKEKVIKIWRMMKTAEVQVRKRRGGDDATGPGAKKAKHGD